MSVKSGKNKKNLAKRAVMSEILSWVITLVVAFAIGYILRMYVLINADIPSGSMENSIMTGDRLIGSRLAYLNAEPERGDIIIFNYPDDPSQKFTKRVIGLPGEHVEIVNSKIYIDDSKTPLEEPYLKEDWVIATGPYSYDVPEDSYFVLGDNRNNSLDARYWTNTYVTKENIIGEAEFVYWPFNHISKLTGTDY